MLQHSPPLFTSLPFSAVFVSLSSCISTELYSPPPIHHLESLESPLTRSKIVCSRKSSTMTKPGPCRGVHFGNVLLIQATEIKSVSSCQDVNAKKKKAETLYVFTSPSEPCSMAKFFPRGMGRSTEWTDVVSSLRARACAPLREELAAGKSTRTRKGVLAFPTNGSLRPLAWFKNLLAFSAQKSHPPREKISPCPRGEADPPSRRNPQCCREPTA